MNKTLNKALADATEMEFLQVRHRMNFAGFMYDGLRMYAKHGLTKNEIIDKVGLKRRQSKAFFNGAYNYDLLKMSIVEALFAEYAERTEKLKHA